MSVIDTNKLSHLLAEYAGITEEETSRFLESFASVVSKHVKSGEDVEVQGLGKFIVIDTKQTEMRRVALMLAESMKDEVNSPFSFFEPYIISKGNIVETKSVVDEIDLEKKAEDPVVVIEESSDKLEPSDIIDTTEPVAEDSADNQDELLVYSDKSNIITEEDNKISEKDSIQDYIEENNASTGSINHKQYFWVTVCIILSLLIIGIILLFLLGTKNNESEVDGFDSLSNEETLVVDSICESIDTLEQAVDIPKILTDSIGTPMKVTLQQGERLTLIALRYFGSKDFWPYVYEVNKDRLSSPSNVPAGAVLHLPNPSYYGIDALSVESIEKAKEFGREILNNK